MEYIIHLLILVGIYVILAQSFNVIFGLGFQFNLAHVAVYAIGAYTTALLATGLKYCPLESICIDLEPMGTFSCIVFSMLTSGLLAFLIGGISLKLALDYFAIGTIAFSSVISALLINWKSLTRGVLGIPGIPRPEVMGLELYDNWYFLAFVCVLVVFTLLVVHRVFYSALGRGLRAQSQHPYAVQALGKNAVALRTAGFVISSLFAGLAGSLFAYYINYIDPSSFSLTEMVFVLTIVIVGRPGSFWGCIVASFFLVLLPEPLRFLEIPSSILGPMRQLLYALILFTSVYINRGRLFPERREI